VITSTPGGRESWRATHRLVVTLLLSIACLLSLAHAQAEGRLTLNFNPDWKFIRADPSSAEQIKFNDAQWSSVSTPHTLNDVDTFDDWSLSNHRGEQNQWSGRTWYRKTFTLPNSFVNKKIFIEFEAARQVAEIYLNGKLLGVSKTGFTPFGFDLTPHLHFDAPNVLAVMCDNRFVTDPAPGDGSKKSTPTLAQISARVNEAIPEDVEKVSANELPWNNPHWHPAHGGIYRNVRLYVTDPLHIALPLYSFLQTEGPYVYASGGENGSALVNLEVPIENGRGSAQKLKVSAEVFDPQGKRVLSAEKDTEIAVNGKTGIKLSGILEKPEFWEPGYPFMYRVVISLREGAQIIDHAEIPLGIRNPKWNAQTGFYINGRAMKLHGWGQKPTDEWPGLGAAQPDWMHFYTLSLMQEAGGNFVRWGHCAGGPASIVAADRLGIITDQPGVDGESDTRGAAWAIRAEAFRDTIIYFRNHPSILIWEGGNQKVSRAHAKELRTILDRYDPHGGRAFTFRRADETDAEFMDICLGTEGSREIARLPVVEGEYDREESPRRVWDDFSPPNFGYPEGKGQTYQLTSEQYAVNQVSEFLRKAGAADHCGGANWIFSDSTSGGRVGCEVARSGGEVDGVRLPKEAYYVCQAMFRDDPQVHILGHWTYPADTKKTVYVISNGEEVELLLNGKSLGRARPRDHFLFAFDDVAWQPGELKAVAFAHGKTITTQTKRTTGPAVALRLTSMSAPDGLQADGSDIALFDVEAVDAQGQRCPTVQQRVEFETSGPAVWRGGYNSGKTNSINSTLLDLECGVNRVAIRATRTAGEITLRAKSDGLKPATITLQSQPIPIQSGFSHSLPLMPSVPLPKTRLPEFTTVSLTSSKSVERPPSSARYAKSFSYSGPTTAVHLESNVQPRKSIYLDQPYSFHQLPGELLGADWVQAANADKFFSAVDLMEIAVESGTLISVAHDDRLPRPAWLTRLFEPTNTSLDIEGQAMKIFQRRAKNSESLTFGSNLEDSKMPACHMYVVFIGPASQTSAGTKDATAANDSAARTPKAN